MEQSSRGVSRSDARSWLYTGGTRLVAPGPRRRGRDLGFDDAQEFSDLASIVQGVS